MFFSISLTIYNRTELSEFCIKSILERIPREQYEFIVIDNGSQPDTIKMLKNYESNFDKLILEHKNNLGSAINDAWINASSKADWMIVFSNDNFCMEGWFENFKLIIESNLQPDVIFCLLRPPEFDKYIPFKIKNSGTYYKKNKTNWYGAGLSIKKKIVDLYNLRFIEGNEPWTGGSIYTHFGKRIHKLGLKIVHLGKPCILTQDCQFSNPKYMDYYNEVFNYIERTGGKIAFKNISKYESLRLRGGYIDNPDEYYKDSDYKIGKHYRDALNSDEGKTEFNRLKFLSKKKLKIKNR